MDLVVCSQLPVHLCDFTGFLLDPQCIDLFSPEQTSSHNAVLACQDRVNFSVFSRTWLFGLRLHVCVSPTFFFDLMLKVCGHFRSNGTQI